MNTLEEILSQEVKKPRVLNYAFVGSTISVNDKNLIKNSDRDILILVENINQLKYNLVANNWDLESYIINISQDIDKDSFVSFRKNNVNLIVTESTEFFNKFLIATEVATFLNLVDKENRVRLFQFILYGNVV